MVSYLDTSFLWKLYVTEPHSEDAVAWFRQYSGTIAISDLSDIEMISSLYRRLPQPQAENVHSFYSGDKVSGVYEHLSVDKEVLALALALAKQYAGTFGLRSLDAIHLAIARRYSVDTLATFDTRLSKAAQASGLQNVFLQP